MSILSGKKILLGISGGIAAYKTPNLVRSFIKQGAEVKVVMTDSAKEFVTPLSLSTVSNNPVFSSFKSDEEEGVWNNHVELGLWCDIMLICPATANTLFKMANGNCDNLLIAVYLSCKSNVFFAPAMDLDMYKHNSTKESVKKLQSFGNILIPPAVGELASGLSGEGRLPEPEEVVEFIHNHYSANLPLNGKKVLISAGPTVEQLDPVRFISNHSSGKMGYSLAETALSLGGDVTLVSGPTNQIISSKKIHLINVKTGNEMYSNILDNYEDADIVIMAAAVSDYKPKEFSQKKIKKDNKEINIKFEKTTDILNELGKHKKNQFLVGFALENDNEIINAKTKLKNKNLDLIVLNSLNDKGAGFGYDTNKVSLINKSDEIVTFDLKEKSMVALDIFNYIIKTI
ncbi:MAG: bifunctional phosphopantothenoylcysteine decarboxylase/phosphopantothenate--cysteine ligase CoaBC [Flavobacteriales bacterium]|nr:bifunctional phosphopantothenoylcysteine decarboxylase/phosphopantothenate--cysteine ligase CoaBC [Flavobacteriales bacterium]